MKKIDPRLPAVRPVWPTGRHGLTAVIGLALIGVYAAVHVGLVLAERERTGLGVLAGVAFVLLEYTSMANLVTAHGWGLRLSAAASYVVLLFTLGGMRELYFGAGNSWLTARTLAWWATACGCGAAAQVAFALRETMRKGEVKEAQRQAHQDDMEALSMRLQADAAMARMQAKEETKRQLAMAKMQALQATPPPIVPPERGLSQQQRRNELQRLLLADPQSNLHLLSPLLECSPSTLSRDAKAMGFVYDEGVWRNDGSR